MSSGDAPLLEWEGLSRADREREYSPSSRLDGPIEPFIEAYRTRSAEQYDWCEEVGITVQEIPYGPFASNTIDLVVPNADEPVPLVIFIHGGYWQELSKRESFLGAKDCLKQGIAFAAIDYTLAPHSPLDAIVDECRTAVAELASKATELNLDPARMLITGSSAGAHLAAMVALDRAHFMPPAIPLAGCCLLSGVFELDPLVGTSINDAVGLDMDSAHSNSPGRHDLDGFPPTLIAYGSDETEQFKRQSERFAALLHLAGTNVSAIEVADRNHFDVVFDLCDPHTDLGRRLLALVDGYSPDGSPNSSAT